jgi:hypothetical protein
MPSGGATNAINNYTDHGWLGDQAIYCANTTQKEKCAFHLELWSLAWKCPNSWKVAHFFTMRRYHNIKQRMPGLYSMLLIRASIIRISISWDYSQTHNSSAVNLMGANQQSPVNTMAGSCVYSTELRVETKKPAFQHEVHLLWNTLPITPPHPSIGSPYSCGWYRFPVFWGIRKTWTVDNGEWTVDNCIIDQHRLMGHLRVNNHICHYPLVPRSRAYPHKSAWRHKKFLLWCGNIENCHKIDHICSATYKNLRPEETRPFGISSPKSRTATNPKTTPTEGYTWAAGFPQFRQAISR